MIRTQYVTLTTSLTAIAAACLLAGCGGSDDNDNSSNVSNMVVSGVVASTAVTPGSSTEPTVVAGYYRNAKVCVDANNNGACDTTETSAITDTNGKFTLTLPSASASPLIADIGTSSVNTAALALTSKGAVAARIALRAGVDQVAEQATTGVVISPLSSEVLRMVEASNSTYKTEKQNLATRVSTATTAVTADQVLADYNKSTPTAATLAEANALGNRFAYATAKLDRKDKYPDALAVAGGDIRLMGNVTDPRPTITFAQAQQAAFNVEGIPRYDSIFIVMLENKASLTILNSNFAPKINAYLKEGNQLTSYFATGNPSEPNYTALGGADDFGITDDSQWNCDATGANAVQDLPLPDKTAAGLAASPFNASCAQTAAVNHNIVGKPNLFTAMTNAGLTWRTYSESMNPGQDFRTDSVTDTAVTVPDHVYPAGTMAGNTATIGNSTLALPLPGGLYKTKHHPGMAYQNVRSAPEWSYSNRTLGGGQWDSVLLQSTLYKSRTPANYNVDQFGADLVSGNVGNLNFVIPDQCDDMHGISVSGKDGTGATVTASDCGSISNNEALNSSRSNIITRGDNYVANVVEKIRASQLWKNPTKKIAIVLMFDEGSATAGFNSCCGWNPGNSTVAQPLTLNADGTYSVDTTVNNYTKGNRGHGESIFGILTNQTAAPKGIVDNDSYSHFSFVRTLQDMFQLADPAQDQTYMNRSKYSEKFVADHILNLPEYQASADTHFDSVRPINHAFVPSLSYTQKQSLDVNVTAQVGPDANQTNVWAIAK